jgi:hypothetical protein
LAENSEPIATIRRFAYDGRTPGKFSLPRTACKHPRKM